MAERPYITGAIAVGIVAAALHISTSSAPSPVSQSSTASLADTHSRHAITPSKTPDQVLWSTAMNNDPMNLGKVTAQKELDEAITDFYHPTPEAAANTHKAAAEAKPPQATSADGNKVSDALEVMIAIEPDPVHTHLSLLFDRDIDTLEDALQSSGWQYQSNWMPWSPSSSAPAGARFVDQEQQRLFDEGREQYPGVILFRSDQPRQALTPEAESKGITGSQSAAPADAAAAGSRTPLAVFVVGNSPTGGMDRTQFEEALVRLKTLAPHQDRLRILGPSFTGSGPSLRSLLRDAHISYPNLQHITIASGSISDPKCEDILPGKTSESNVCTTSDLPDTTFVSFGIDKDWRTEQIASYLRTYGRFGDEEIAELTEDVSSYGWIQPAAVPQIDPKQAAVRQSDPNQPAVRQHLYFPRNISHLRNAYQKSNIFGFGATTQGPANISLNLDFEEGGADDDTIPNFATQQMPVSQDGVMHQISTVLEQRRIKVVILSATDVLDELFVAEILAREAPNTLVIINQADNLFLRSNSTSNFGSMYFVSPWPLITDSQLWSRPAGGPNARIFPSDLSEGLYAAVRYLQPPPRASAADLPDYSSPLSQTNRPPLWLSAVGRGAFWPVALLDAADPPGTAQRSGFHLPAITQQEVPTGIFSIEFSPLSQHLILLLLCLFAFYHASKCIGIPAFHNLSFRYILNDPDARTPKLTLQLSMTVFLLIVLQLCISTSNTSSLALMAFHVSTAALCVTTVYLIYLMALNLLHRMDTPQPWPERIFILITIALISWGAYVAANGLWHSLWDWLSKPPPGLSDFSDFFRYRAASPLSGISPVFPLALSFGALFVFFYNHLDRIAFTENLAPRLPPKIAGLPNCPSGDELKPATSLLEWPPKSSTILRKLALLAIIVGTVLICIKPLHLRPRMFDGPHLQRSLGLAMFFLVVAILWELTMAATIWQRLKFLCLDQLESSSLRRGFSTVSGITWSSLWIFRGNRSARYRAISRLLEQASRQVFEPVATYQEAGSSLKQSAQTIFEAISSNSDVKVIEAFGPLQDQIAAAAGRLLTSLRSVWYREKNRITAPDAIEGDENSAGAVSSEPDKPIEPLQRLCEEWVALVYIHYIRMVLLQIRSRLITAVVLYVFLIWAGTSYPYLNRHVMLIALSALLGILSFSIISIYASINRDAILSRTTNHTPGHLDLDFYLKIASFVGVPLLGFVAAQFPEVNGFLFSWIEPGMTAFK
jgi:hypothetical protein